MLAFDAHFESDGDANSLLGCVYGPMNRSSGACVSTWVASFCWMCFMVGILFIRMKMSGSAKPIDHASRKPAEGHLLVTKMFVWSSVSSIFVRPNAALPPEARRRHERHAVSARTGCNGRSAYIVQGATLWRPGGATRVSRRIAENLNRRSKRVPCSANIIIGNAVAGSPAWALTRCSPPSSRC